MTTDNFFDQPREQSQVKSSIVIKHFGQWSQVMLNSQDRNRRGLDNRIAYVDLFAGRGRYSNGTPSTPLLVLEKAIQDERMRRRLVTVFNDKDPDNAEALRQSISELPGVDTLVHPPVIYSQEVDESVAELFSQRHFVPTLFFVDPWGYKGLSLHLIDSLLKDWGCDCIFFFNYLRINMGLENTAVTGHIDALFGKERADKLRYQLDRLDPQQRELAVVGEFCQAIEDLGHQYVLPFRFKDDRGTRTSHHLIFACKGFRGYELMKETLAKESTTVAQGVATFEYNRVESHVGSDHQLLLELSSPLDQLGDMLLKEFARQTLTMQEVYMRHNVGRPFIKRNYKEVLKQLEDAGKITASPHRKGTFADDVQVTFPQLGGSE